VRVCESRATCGAEGSAEHGELYTYGSQRGGSGEGHRVTVAGKLRGSDEHAMEAAQLTAADERSDAGACKTVLPLVGPRG
jgi:hypothetical protein